MSQKYDLNDPAIKALTAANVKLMFSMAFIGQLALHLKPVDASEWLSTAATDGKHFFYNRDFILDLNPEELIFLVGHEVLHCVFDHMSRRGHRDKLIFNMAADFLVNYTLKSHDIGEMIKGGLYDKEYTDAFTVEEIYELLIQNSVKIQMPLDEHLDYSEQGDQNSDSDEGRGQPKDGQGKTVDVTVIGKHGPPKLTQKEIDKIRDDFRAKVVQTAGSVGADDIPMAVRRLIDNLVDPKMDWRALLDAHIRSANKDDFTFLRPSRRGDGTYILPGQDFENTIDICIAIDASGSLTEDMLRDIKSEVVGIMETFGDFRIRVWSFDTEVHAYAEFGPQNLDEFLDWQPGGGGGTTFECNWDFMIENDIEPARLVMFTDGLPNHGWGNPDYCDTLFVIIEHPEIEAPWGVTAHYEDAKD